MHGRILMLKGFGTWLASILTNSFMSKLSILVEDIYIYILIKKLLYLDMIQSYMYANSVPVQLYI